MIRNIFSVINVIVNVFLMWYDFLCGLSILYFVYLTEPKIKFLKKTWLWDSKYDWLKKGDFM